MNILYVGPISENGNAINGGYTYVANAFNKLFLSLKEKKIIDKYTGFNPDVQNGSVALHAHYDIGIILTHPDSFNHPIFKTNIENLKKYCSKFYLHIFWEISKLADRWDWLFEKNSMFTGFIASSNFNKKIILNKINQFSSLQKVVKVYPFIQDDFKHIDLEQKNKESKFSVLYMGQYTKRKGMEDAIISFSQALGNKEDCNLILKYHRLSKIEFDDEDLIKRTISMNCASIKAHIYTVVEELNRKQINDLYLDSSLLLFLSRGEGFGLPLVEASIIGLPIIYGDNSSCNEVVGANSHRIPCVQDAAINMTQYGYEGDACYGVPLMKHTIEKLKFCYELWKTNRERYYKTDNGKTLLKLFSEENILKQINNLL